MASLSRRLSEHRNTILYALPGVILAVTATWWFLFRGPGLATRHEAYLRPDTAMRAVLCPARVQSYVSSLAPTATRFVHGIPKLSSMQGGPIRFDWLHKMPFEMAFLFDQAMPGRFGVTLFLQENPAGEPLDDLINGSSFLADLRPIVWNSPVMRREAGGTLLVDGQVDIPQETRDLAARMWPQYQPVDAPPIAGNHFLEIGINNGSGALVQLEGALLNLIAPWADDGLQQAMVGACQTVLSAYATGDLSGADRLAFEVRLQCTDPRSAEALGTVCRSAAQALSAYLSASDRFLLEGTIRTDRATVLGEYTLSGFEGRLRRALGG